MFSTKLNKSVDPFGYLNQYSCKVKMALIIASIIISKTQVVSLHIKGFMRFMLNLLKQDQLLKKVMMKIVIMKNKT